jgi:hypothetical protein
LTIIYKNFRKTFIIRQKIQIYRKIFLYYNRIDSIDNYFINSLIDKFCDKKID